MSIEVIDLEKIKQKKSTSLINQEKHVSRILSSNGQKVEFDRVQTDKLRDYLINKFDSQSADEDQSKKNIDTIQAIEKTLRQVSNDDLLYTINRSTIQDWDVEPLFYAAVFNKVSQRSEGFDYQIDGKKIVSN